MIVMGKNDTLG